VYAKSKTIFFQKREQSKGLCNYNVTTGNHK